MVPFARRGRNWKLLILVVTLMFAASPLAMGIIFQQSALQYATFTTTIVVCGMIAVVMGFSRGERSAGRQFEGVVEYAIFLTALHIVSIVAFCLDGVAVLKDISGASTLVFVFMFIIVLIRFDQIFVSKIKNPGT